jgi:hypothetical protein
MPWLAFGPPTRVERQFRYGTNDAVFIDMWSGFVMRGPTALIAVATITSAIGASSADAVAAPTNVTCTPNQVGVFSNRVFVRCSGAAGGGITYFAFATSDAPAAARVLSILSTAHVAGRTLGISYEPNDTSGAAIGCPPNDCRLISGVWFN